MWSIHPDQIDVIVSAFAPRTTEIETAADILLSAESAKWAPIRHHDRLHDRASYRYYWTVLERAHRTGQPLRQDVRDRFFSDLACRPAT
jgi:citrate lyase subunit beta/citryl-CoA lyase